MRTDEQAALYEFTDRLSALPALRTSRGRSRCDYPCARLLVCVDVRRLAGPVERLPPRRRGPLKGGAASAFINGRDV